MEFNSLFDDAMKIADEQIEGLFSKAFALERKHGDDINIHAIFDGSLMMPGGKNTPPFSCEQGALTVLNQRINKNDVKGATVITPIGERTVVDVFYPDATTSILKLSVTTEGSSGGHHGRFVRAG